MSKQDNDMGLGGVFAENREKWLSVLAEVGDDPQMVDVWIPVNLGFSVPVRCDSADPKSEAIDRLDRLNKTQNFGGFVLDDYAPILRVKSRPISDVDAEVDEAREIDGIERFRLKKLRIAQKNMTPDP